MKRFWLLLIICGFFSANLYAVEDYYQFQSQKQQQRFTVLTSELRCLVCQNQNLAQSNSGLASDLRGQIYQQILQGRSDQEILDYLLARYGDYILYRPPFNAATLGLWVAPFMLLVCGVGYLLFYLRKKSREKS